VCAKRVPSTGVVHKCSGDQSTCAGVQLSRSVVTCIASKAQTQGQPQTQTWKWMRRNHQHAKAEAGNKAATYRRILHVDCATGQGRIRAENAAKNDGLLACGSEEAVSAAPTQA
jgi:hypothetical protein